MTSTDDFLTSGYFGKNDYCKHGIRFLQLYTSLLYLAAAVGSFFASFPCRRWGRKANLTLASLLFLGGAVLNAGAKALWMTVAARLLLGAGTGFGNNAVPLLLSELAPAGSRRRQDTCFRITTTVGTLVANVVIIFARNITPWGWRLSLGLAGIPALVLLVASLLLVDAPAGVVHRGKEIEEEEDVEFIFPAEAAVCTGGGRPGRDLGRSGVPPLVMTVAIQIFQQFTGTSVIMSCAPVLSRAVGFNGDASLLSAAVTALVNVVSKGASIAWEDRWGSCSSLLEPCVQMLACQIIGVGGVLALHFRSGGGLSFGYAAALVGSFAVGFSWSWGPMGWPIPVDIFPPRTRTTGMLAGVAANMLCTFLIAQALFSTLCSSRSAVFFFFSGWLVLMTVLLVFVLPETKRVPLEEPDRRV